MDYFDIFDTEDKINEIEKKDCLYTEGVISLDNERNRKMLDLYAYELYLKEFTTNEEEGGTNE